jgi:hypothetical protein
VSGEPGEIGEAGEAGEIEQLGEPGERGEGGEVQRNRKGWRWPRENTKGANGNGPQDMAEYLKLNLQAYFPAAGLIY